MKVGILTFHAQVNYGGVLQAFALQEVLKCMGHEVVIIDKWIDEWNCNKNGIISSHSFVGWLKFIGRAALGFGDFADYIRHVRTARMLPSLLNLTPYSFYHWKDAPARLDVDFIVVGSDQVWNPRLQGEELPYLLDGAPSVPAVAYAASFGMPKLPSEVKERYRAGFKRFKAISVREAEGVRIVNSLGGAATHVLDPTLLADKKIWNRFSEEKGDKQRKKLVCYLIQDPLGYVLDDIGAFAKRQNCDVEIFLGGPCAVLPSNLKELILISTGFLRSVLMNNVHTRAMATPDEFVHEMATADWVLTDSFHALMFSTIFQKNVRVLKPRNGRGVAGFARLSEFARENICTPIMCDGISTALESLLSNETTLFNCDKIEKARKQSLAWLTTTIKHLI